MRSGGLLFAGVLAVMVGAWMGLRRQAVSVSEYTLEPCGSAWFTRPVPVCESVVGSAGVVALVVAVAGLAMATVAVWVVVRGTPPGGGSGDHP